MPDYEIQNKIAEQITVGLNDPMVRCDYATPNFSAYVSREMLYSIECSSTHIKVHEWRNNAAPPGNRYLPWFMIKEIPLADPNCIEKAIEEANRIRNARG